MSMNIYKYELWAYRNKLILWNVVFVAMLSLFLSLFPIYAESAEETIKIFSGLPETVRNALGINLEQFFSLPGYFAFVFTYLSLCGAIQAMDMGLSSVTKENRMKTADFLLTKPVKRREVFMAKLSANLTALLITNLIFTATTLAVSAAVADVSAESYSLIYLIVGSLLLIQLVFLSIGVLMGTVAKKIKYVLSYSLSTVFAFYAISMLGSIIGEEKVKFLSPFKFFDPNTIVNDGKYDPVLLSLAIVLVILANGIALTVYNNKEIHSV